VVDLMRHLSNRRIRQSIRELGAETQQLAIAAERNL
jgi:hypothetical protein